MARKPSFSLTGMGELEAALRELSGAPQELENQLLEVAEDIAENARKRVPVLTGALQRSIQVDHDGRTIRVVAGGPSAPYAGRIHARKKGRGRKFIRLAALKAVRTWRAKSPLARAIYDAKRAKRKAHFKARKARR